MGVTRVQEFLNRPGRRSRSRSLDPAGGNWIPLREYREPGFGHLSSLAAGEFQNENDETKRSIFKTIRGEFTSLLTLIEIGRLLVGTGIRFRANARCIASLLLVTVN
jgi:hypothetical protein